MQPKRGGMKNGRRQWMVRSPKVTTVGQGWPRSRSIQNTTVPRIIHRSVWSLPAATAASGFQMCW